MNQAGRVFGTWLITAALFLGSPVFAADLSPDLQTAFEKGMAAAQQNEWDIAIKYFSQVIDADPYYSPAYFNLALACQKKDAVLPALAWFHAYLYHVPADKDAAVIKKEISSLEVATEVKVSKILKQAVELAAALPEKAGDYGTPRGDVLGSIFTSYVRAGLSEEAVKLTAAYKMAVFYTPEYAKGSYVSYLVDQGDIAEAAQLADQLSGQKRIEAYGDIARYYTSPYSSERDIDKALSYIAKIEDISQWLYISSVVEDILAADRPAEAKQLAEKITDPKKRFEVTVKIAGILYKKGDKTGAEQALGIAGGLYEELQKDTSDSYGIKDRALLMSKALAALGHQPEAKSIADTLSAQDIGAWQKMDLYLSLGDVAGAETQLPLITDELSQKSSIQNIFEAWVKKGKIREAEAYLSKIPQTTLIPYSYAQAYAQVAWLKMKAGDSRALESMVNLFPASTSYDKPGEYGNRDAYYWYFCTVSSEAGDLAGFEKYYAKLGIAYFKAQSLRYAAVLRHKAGQLDEAVKFLTRDMTVWEPGNDYMLFDGEAVNLVSSYLDKAEKDKALALLDQVTPIAEKNNKHSVFKKLAEFYEKAGQSEKGAALRRKAADMAWIDLAKSFMSDTDTMDPDVYFKKIQSETAEKIPVLTADLAVKYATNLRKIQKLSQA